MQNFTIHSLFSAMLVGITPIAFAESVGSQSQAGEDGYTEQTIEMEAYEKSEPSLTMSRILHTVSNVWTESSDILTSEQREANDLLTNLLEEAEKVTIKAHSLSTGNYGCARQAGEAFGDLMELIARAQKTFSHDGSLQHAIVMHKDTITSNYQQAVDDGVDDDTLLVLSNQADDQVARLSDAHTELQSSSKIFEKMGLDFTSSKKSARHLCKFGQTDLLVGQIEELVRGLQNDVGKVKKFLEPSMLPES